MVGEIEQELRTGVVHLGERHRNAEGVVVSFEELHSDAVVDLVMPRRFVELEHHMMAVGHTTMPRIVLGRMRTVPVVDYVVAEHYNRLKVCHWVGMMTAEQTPSILLLANCLQKNIRSCFPAARISESM